ncbi:MAG: phage Mu protein gp47-like protein [Puniceicoccaceae bacterium 5H]|nr:MAG: phage Mu protein gp47-like protein [Puniceicoccaceae bacterium 5H]
MSMVYLCCDKRRRVLLREENARRQGEGLPLLNGIDYLEVLDRDAPAGIERQRTLLVRFFEDVPALSADNVALTGGERVTPVRIIWAHPALQIPASEADAAERDFFAGLSEPERLLVVRTDSDGDFSTYRLAITSGAGSSVPPEDFDPLFAEVAFSFKVECASDFDCASTRPCPPQLPTPPQIDYLAKDYASFRRVLLDRISLLMPQWRDRSPADLGVTLVELLAYLGDRLSYRQDAIATEAYLDTARRRVSVRRHARLVDYRMHDGCNARAWTQIRCAADVSGTVLPAGTVLLTRVFPDRPVLFPASERLEDALRTQPTVFETLHPLRLFGLHQEMDFYTWGDERCCLPQGATRATLAGHFPDLQPGDVLVFGEVLNPHTGEAVDADRRRRHAVRLTEVVAFDDGDPLTDPVTGEEVTQIAWHAADALPFPFCISSVADPDQGEENLAGVSVAWGNIVLADHGQSLSEADLGAVPPPRRYRRPETGDPCASVSLEAVPPRFRPVLPEGPLTHACRFDAFQPASAANATDPADAVPALELRGELEGDSNPWTPQRDLLNSTAGATEFVVEIERDGRAYLRFGDNRHGQRPPMDTHFTTTRYRVGNGKAGNIGQEALFHIVTSLPGVTGARNPLPAQGGTEPETMEQVRHRAPEAFRTQERAVTAADYAAVAERDPQVQRAAATFRWTGSWHTVYLTVDPLGGVIRDAAERERFITGVLDRLEGYRMAGYDLEADEPRYVSLEVEMHVCVRPGYFRAAVKAALLEVFSNRRLPDGRRGVFHPDNFTFGQTVHLSPLYAAAQAVPGVASVEVTAFQRQGQPSNAGLLSGKLPLDRLEIARLDNDPNCPERGLFRLTLGGGK